MHKQKQKHHVSQVTLFQFLFKNLNICQYRYQDLHKALNDKNADNISSFIDMLQFYFTPLNESKLIDPSPFQVSNFTLW